jgi:hypothetical protein
VAEADRGVHVILGTVLPDPQTPIQISDAWHLSHTLREGHPYVHGANFGIRADTYLSLQGWPKVATGEDVLLARRARNAGHLRILRTAAIPVLTSGRLAGRAPNGFAGYLRAVPTSVPTSSSAEQ